MTLDTKSSRALAFAIAGGLFITAPLILAQAPAYTDSPKLSEPFTFTLSPSHDYALSAVTKAIEQHDQNLRAKELEDAQAGAFNRAADLLRYLPIRLSNGAADDFFTPAYLRRDYATLPADAHLFDRR